LDTTQSRIDVVELIDERSMSAVQWLVAIACGLTMFVDGYDLQVMALAVPSVAQQWGIAPSHFSFALSAVSIGLGLGGAFVAPFGDRLGRRTLVIAGLAIAGLATLATGTASSTTQFVIWRIITGIGLGASIPNCNAWTSEYTPLRGRATVLVLMNAAIGVGAFLAGFIAPPILNAWGWRGTFFVGGIVPLAIAALTALTTPESLKFLISRRPGDPRIASTLRRIAPEVGAASPKLPDPSVQLPRASVTELLGTVYQRRTLMLWGVVLANLFTLYVLISWLPQLLISAGWSLEQALRGAVLIQAGGVLGGLVLSVCVDRRKTLPAMFVAFLAATVSLGLFAIMPSGAAWVVMLCLIGGGVSGSQLALNALSTAYYPSAIKATGMSWVGVVGTIGSIVAPFAGGWLIGEHVAAVNILALLGVAPLLCAIAVLFMKTQWQGG
jgi:MFS transporter, AAHS family, 4-hydroxybenzoate transporter